MVAVHDDEFAQQAIRRSGEGGEVDDGRRSLESSVAEVCPRADCYPHRPLCGCVCLDVHVYTLMQFKNTRVGCWSECE